MTWILWVHVIVWICSASICTLQVFNYFFNKCWISGWAQVWKKKEKLSSKSPLKQRPQRKDSTGHAKSKLALSWLSFESLDVSVSLLEYVRSGLEGEWRTRCCHSLSCHRAAWGDVSVTVQAKALMHCSPKLMLFHLETANHNGDPNVYVPL